MMSYEVCHVTLLLSFDCMPGTVGNARWWLRGRCQPAQEGVEASENLRFSLSCPCHFYGRLDTIS